MSYRAFFVLLLIGVAAVGLLTPRLLPSVGAPPKTHSLSISGPASPPKPDPIGNGYASVTLDRSADSHFYADAEVNGAPIRFIIDTGASSVVLTRDDAQRAGLVGGEFSLKGIGAGGEVRLMPVTIQRLAVGPLDADNVPAMVAENGLPVSLLGQTFLSRIGTVSISGDRMELR